MQLHAAHVRFLHRARRRWMAWRTLEAAGIGAAIAAALASIIVSILLMRGETAIMPAGVLLSLGATIGIIFGLTRKPTLLQTAMMADQQLGLHDLLSSTLRKQSWGDEGFRRIVFAQAEVLCSARSPNELIVQRLGGRAWGGIGIASALVMTLAMMSSQPGMTAARDVTIPAHSADQTNELAGKKTEQRAESQLAQSAVRQNRPLKPADLGLDEGSGDRWSSEQSSSKSARRSGQADDGAGPAAGRSTDAQTSPLDFVGRPGEPAQGVGGTTLFNAGHGMSSQATAGINADPIIGTGQSKAISASPWNTAGWSNDPSQAGRKVELGEIPESYRDLIRDYFDLPRR
ncbi:MAG TPA: hypothetical protein VHD56_13365 [Tepidisphaeraceae bacterium]|nr:hypothetical protein [Tepidisphaeraceae bacterium]